MTEKPLIKTIYINAVNGNEEETYNLLDAKHRKTCIDDLQSMIDYVMEFDATEWVLDAESEEVLTKEEAKTALIEIGGKQLYDYYS